MIGYREKRVVVIILWILLFTVLFFLAVMIIDCNRFVVKEYTWESDKLQKDGKFILLSDLHNKSFGEKNEKLFRTIEKQNPDVILIAGDMYTAAKNQDNSDVAEFVSRLSKKYPVYYGNGNHEHKTKLYREEFGNLYEPYMNRVKEAGAVVLVNENIAIPQFGICVYGREVERRFYQKFTCPKMEEDYLKRSLGTPAKEKVNLLIAHNPDYFEAYAEWGADLVVSGHVHGGLMRLPLFGGVISPRLRLFPHYDGGRFEKDGSTMILGRGLGAHTLPIRIFNPGELVVIHMRKSRT